MCKQEIGSIMAVNVAFFVMVAIVIFFVDFVPFFPFAMVLIQIFIGLLEMLKHGTNKKLFQHVRKIFRFQNFYLLSEIQFPYFFTSCLFST